MALLYHPDVNTTRLYFGTDTHAQSILVGAVLACVLTIVQRAVAGREWTLRSARSSAAAWWPSPGLWAWSCSSFSPAP